MSTASTVQYPVVVYPDHTTSGAFCYVAEHPDLPGAVGFGDTIEEAKTQLAKARVNVLKAFDLRRETPPAPGSKSRGSAEMLQALPDPGYSGEGPVLQVA